MKGITLKKQSSMFSVYIAGPITAGDDALEQRNVKEALEVSIILVKRGLAVYLPHISWYADQVMKEYGKEPMNHDYLPQDKHWVSMCDAILRLSGKSKGADIEVQYAREHNVPVFAVSQSLSCEKPYSRIIRILYCLDAILYLAELRGHTVRRPNLSQGVFDDLSEWY